MNQIKKKLICVVGATASGKTGLGVALAKKFRGEIVSADSRQVYRGLNIGTGKDLAEYGNINYHLIDICEPGEKFTMFDWLELAKKVIDDIWKRGKTPVVVGGTGLYIQGLIKGFRIAKKLKPKTKNSNSKFKIYTRQELDSFDLKKLQLIAKKYRLITNEANEANSYKLDINNSRRLIRYIEQMQAGETPTSHKINFDYILIAPDWPREELYRRIDKRVDDRFKEGMLEEVEGLIKDGVDIDWLLSLGLEYRIIGEYLIKNLKQFSNPSRLESRSEADLAIEPHFAPASGGASRGRQLNNGNYSEMVQDLKWKIHAYARRQLTWWRRFPIKWTDNQEQAKKICQKFLSIDKQE